MMQLRWTWSAVPLIGAVAGLAVTRWSTPVEGPGPVALIVAPASGSKLRQGQTLLVRVRVGHGRHPLNSWKLQVLGPDGFARELATGRDAAVDQDVSRISADTLPPGDTYTIVLDALDTAGQTATDRVGILVPDPQYALIPLEPGNRLGRMFGGMSLDGSGNLSAFGGSDPHQVILADARTGTFRTVNTPVASNEGFHISADGRRFFFYGNFQEFLAIASFPLDDPAHFIPGPHTNSPFFAVDRTGTVIAFQSPFNLDPRGDNPDGTPEYFLYDDGTKEIRQLTSGPGVIDYSASCPEIVGSSPVISADGATVVFATKATLGMAPEDTRGGCHIFAYDVASRTSRLVRTLPSDAQQFDLPVISDDGRWLTFTITRRVPPDGGLLGVGGQLDVRRGHLDLPVGGVTDFPEFDAVTTGDGSATVISTQADLDPRVGNSDHNLELFVYEPAAARFTQVTETTGGVGKAPGGCEPARPVVSSDARVVAFAPYLFSVESCQLDGPQRNEADGFVFGRVRAVRRRPGNHPPTLDGASDARVEAGATLALEFAATDADGDPIGFFAQMPDAMDVPPGSQINDRHNGTATFRWLTKTENVGTYRLRIGAFDEGGGEAVNEFGIAVCDHIVRDGELPGVLSALFESLQPASCHDADRNGDSVISVADVLSALSR